MPDARVVYVDYEPVDHAHAAALLADNPNTAIIHADLRDTDAVLDHPQTRALLEFDRPIGLLMVGVLLFIADADQPGQLVATYRDRLAAGSLAALSHIAVDEADAGLRAEVGRLVAAYQQANEHIYVRDREQMLDWFDGMRLVEPGFVLLPDWRPDNTSEHDTPARVLGYGGVARIG